MRRGVSEIAVAGVIGSVAYNATASLGVAALVRPLAVTGVLAPAVAAAALPIALIAIQARPDLTEPPNLRDLAQNLRPRRMGNSLPRSSSQTWYARYRNLDSDE